MSTEGLYNRKEMREFVLGYNDASYRTPVQILNIPRAMDKELMSIPIILQPLELHVHAGMCTPPTKSA